jgi:ABC-2 type transport system permease protein
MQYTAAIFWAHWRTLRNFYPRYGIGWTAAMGLGWYGMWAAAAIFFFRVFSDPSDVSALRTALPSGLLLMFLYWQVMPLLLATTGSSLDLRKLRAYPVPEGRLFFIEVLLRVTSAVEMIFILVGITLGALLNPALPKWGVLGALYGGFNLILAVGLRDLLARQLARKRIREIAILLLILCAALPQLMLVRRGLLGGPARLLGFHDAGFYVTWLGWPWVATANVLMGEKIWQSSAALFGWILLAFAFSSWQFRRSLRFDFDAAQAGSASARAGLRTESRSWLYRWPSALLRDPLAAMVEKELRCLARSSRFRLIYIMGLVFGSLMPLTFIRGNLEGGFFHRNYFTIMCVYSLVLMSESCFWNIFGFDRSAAQIYFLAPVSFTRVLIGKNVTAVFFLTAQMAMLTLICVLFGLPIDVQRLLEAAGATFVVMVLLFAAGNLLSIHQATAINPAQSFRPGAAGRLQAMLFVIYPIALIPLGLAYLARYAFDSQAALYGMLMLGAVVGLLLYKLALDSAVLTAERLKEPMIAALSVGEGPISD